MNAQKETPLLPKKSLLPSGRRVFVTTDIYYKSLSDEGEKSHCNGRIQAGHKGFKIRDPFGKKLSKGRQGGEEVNPKSSLLGIRQAEFSLIRKAGESSILGGEKMKDRIA